jgi:hypothetical protein
MLRHAGDWRIMLGTGVSCWGLAYFCAKYLENHLIVSNDGSSHSWRKLPPANFATETHTPSLTMPISSKVLSGWPMRTHFDAALKYRGYVKVQRFDATSEVGRTQTLFELALVPPSRGCVPGISPVFVVLKNRHHTPWSIDHPSPSLIVQTPNPGLKSGVTS